MSLPTAIARHAPVARNVETRARVSRGRLAVGSRTEYSPRASDASLVTLRASRSSRWRAIETSSSSSHTPPGPGRKHRDGRRTTISRAHAVNSSTPPTVGSRGDQASRATRGRSEMPHVEKNLKIQTDRRVKITDSEIARARRNEIKGFPKTSEKDSGRFEKVQLVTLSTGDAVAPWWTRGPDLPNVADVRAAEELMDRFAEAKAMSESENGKKKLVVLEFIAGWCFACRALHPKMNAICREEFADVLFLRVRKDECPSLCDAMGVENVPFVQLYTTVSGAGEDSAGPANTSAADVPAVQMVDAFSVNLTAPKLAQLRSALRRHKATDNHRETTPTTARWGAFGVPSKPS